MCSWCCVSHAKQNHCCTLKGHLAPISSVDEVDVVMSKLLEDPKTASATHNILGYRVYDQSSGKVVQVS